MRQIHAPRFLRSVSIWVPNESRNQKIEITQQNEMEMKRTEKNGTEMDWE